MSQRQNPEVTAGVEHASLSQLWSAPLQLALSIVLPGAAALRRRWVLAAALLIGGVSLPIAVVAVILTSRGELIGIGLDPDFLLAVAAIAVVAVLARFVALAEVAFTFRGGRWVIVATSVAAVVTMALSTPVLRSAAQFNGARSAVANVFGEENDEPLFSPASPGVAAGGVAAGGSGVASTGRDPGAVVGGDGLTNILVLGGDAGPGRWGMRTDTMILIVIDRASGRTAMISIPRNLTRLQFPPGTPLADEFPNGFDDLANALFTHVNTNPTLVEHYGTSGLQPEAVALVGAIGYSLDVEIDDFALVNMQGFTEVIDAVGGVTLELDQRVPLPPSIPGERPLPSSIGPGFVDMDGALAIGYARARYTDSDYQRMGRQRQLLAALGSQVSAGDALGAFSSVAGVLDDSMRTSLAASEFNDLLDRLGDNSAIRESVGLIPPLIRPGSPDYDQIRAIVDAVQRAVVDDQPSGFGG